MKNFCEQQITIGQLESNLWYIKNKIYQKQVDLAVEFSASDEPIPFADRLGLAYKKLECGQRWSEKVFECAWFHFCGGLLQQNFVKGKKYVLILDINGEGCLYDSQGSAARGITNVSSEFERALGLPGKRVVQLPNDYNNEPIDLWVDAGSNDLFGRFQGGTMVQAEIATCDEAIRDLYYDYWILLDLLKASDKTSASYYSILYALSQVGCMLYNYDQNEIATCKQILQKELSRKGGDTGLTFYATGHAHLDLAWLWPIRETKRKALRTFSTAIAMLERYPFYIFGASQPQQFLWVKENDPVLYDKIRQKVKEGRIELQGAMWVEPDLNITGGESLIRQILYGNKFWMQEFGKEVKIAHLPDVFGFSGALPQILNKCGINNLLTIKMSWNKYNQFPYHTFNWQGIDGSQVLCHMPPEGTYNSAMAPSSVKLAEQKYIEKGKCSDALILFGIGDGGAGPGSEHLERLKRLGSLNGLSPVKSSATQCFFEKIQKDKENFATYNGEMYLEKHQGTYTSQAKNKKYNRRLEKLLQEAELLYTIAWKNVGMPYPTEELELIWKEVLLYQFHDILPGSSIKRVYDESVARYAELECQVSELIQKAAAKIKRGDALTNLSSVQATYLTQNNDDCFINTLPAFSSIAKTEKIDKSLLVATNDTLENGEVRAVFNLNGELVSFLDKKIGREMLSGSSNIFAIYEDNGDAWDMQEGYLLRPRGKFELKSSKSYISGSSIVRQQELVFGKSTLKQKIILSPTEKFLDFQTTIDWQERFKMLKVEFLPNIFTNEVNCCTQFGNIKRSTKENNSIELAQDEICAHKYIDLSAADYGFALLNDCKYGYNAKNGNLKMSVLRSTEYPGTDADRGEHSFNYAIYLHNNSFELSDVAEKAFAYNSNLYPFCLESFICFKSQSAFVECIKKCEQGEGVVIRICEEKGLASGFELTPSFKYKDVFVATADEKIIAKAEQNDYKLNPFEIKTLIYY